MLNIFSVSRTDVYDYLRCPKILSYKIFDNVNKPAYVKKKNPKRNLPYEIGLIGETAVQNTFPVDNSPLFEEGHTNNYQIPSKKQTLSDLKKDLKEIGITIDTQTKDILKDTMRGLDDIKAGIKEKYGKFEILELLF